MRSRRISFALIDTVTAEASFTSIERDLASGGVNEYIYFSFVTLTTLGYGDVAPIAPLTRALAFLEAAFGQLYLTILVAALVGMLLSRETPGAKQGIGQERQKIGAAHAGTGRLPGSQAFADQRYPGLAFAVGRGRPTQKHSSLRPETFESMRFAHGDGGLCMRAHNIGLLPILMDLG